MKSALVQISVSTSEEAHEPIAAILEKVFRQRPSIYTDANTHATTASIFLEQKQWNAATRTTLARHLKVLRKQGFRIGPGKIGVKRLRRQDWAESWKHHFKPIEIGDGLLIKPSWSQKRPTRAQSCVILDPGLSFGTGQHATTLFCLEQLVQCREPQKHQSFLDMGTGSGILAISAAKLGYSPVRAFDFDPESVRISRKNAEQNDVSNRVRIIRDDVTKLPLQTETKFDLICANLIYDLLLSEREKIVNRLAPSGWLVLAGILESQFEEVEKAYKKAGLSLRTSKVRKEWRSGRFSF